MICIFICYLRQHQIIYVIGVEGLPSRGSGGTGSAVAGGSGVYCSCLKESNGADHKYVRLIRHGLIGNDTAVATLTYYNKYDKSNNMSSSKACTKLRTVHASHCSRPTKKELEALRRHKGRVSTDGTNVNVIVN